MKKADKVKIEKLSPEKQAKILKEFGHVPTKEELFEKLMESQRIMTDALKGVWEEVRR